MTDQIIRVDAARVDDIRSYASEIGLTVLFRRLIIAPDKEQEGNQLVPSAAVSIPWQLAVGLREILDEEIKRHEAATGQITVPKVQMGARVN